MGGCQLVPLGSFYWLCFKQEGYPRYIMFFIMLFDF